MVGVDALTLPGLTEKNTASRRRPWPAVAALALALALLLAACGETTTEPFGTLSVPAGEPLVIGLSLDQHGARAGDARTIERAVRLAVEQFEQDRALPLRIEIRDDGCDPRRAYAVAEEFATVPGIAGVIGPMCSGACVEAARAYDEAKLLMLTPSCTGHTVVNQGLETVYRVAWSGDLGPVYGARYAAGELKARRVYAVNDYTFYGKTQRDAFKTQLEDRGGDLIADEILDGAEWDFTSLVADIKAARPDLIFYGGYLPAGRFLIQQLRYAGVTAPVMVGDALRDAAGFIGTADGAAEGVYVLDAEPLHGKNWDAFARAYRERWDEEPGAFGGQGYDAARVLLRALEKTVQRDGRGYRVDREKLRDKVGRTDMQGATGRVRFFPNGERVAGGVPVVLQVENGVFVEVKRYKAEGS